MDIIIDHELSGLMIRDVLQKRLRYSYNMIKKLKFRENGILVNGEFVTVRYILKEGDVLYLAVEDKAEDVSPYTIPVEIPIDVILEDESLTVVNKPPNMPTHPSNGHRDDTVSNALAWRYRGTNYVFRPVNRLDRDTSGCVLTANTKAASYRMFLAMTGGAIRKHYIAVIDGCMDCDTGELRSYMRRCEDSIVKRRETDESDPEGKLAVTAYRVLYTDGAHSVLLLSPITGRTHQLRVHLAGKGCPITGDDMYGDASEHIGRQALHSYITTFPHPETDVNTTVVAPLPSDIVHLIKAVFSDGAGVLDIIEKAGRCYNETFEKSGASSC